MRSRSSLLRPLEELEERLRAFGAPIADALQPGRSEEAVRAALEAEGLRAPAELVTWWGWHDGAGVPPPEEGIGVRQVPENRIFDVFHLESLEDSLQSRRWMRRLYDEELRSPEGFPLGWIPLMTSGRLTLSYCADALADERVAPVYIYDHDGGTPYPPRPQFASLEELIGLFVRLFDTGAVIRDPDDPRLPFIEYPPVSEDARRLTAW